MSIRNDWPAQGACVRVDPELFFPPSTAGPGYQQVERAKLVCAGCPVRDACLSYALTAGIDHGVWGGYSEEERRALRRRTARTRTRVR